MDSKGVDRGVRHQQSSESPPTLPSPLPYSSGFAADDIHNRHRSGIVLRRSPSPSSASEIHKSNKLSKGESPVERRRKKRSQSRSSSTRSHRRSRSRDKDKNREVYKERSRKHARRDRFSRSGSRERSRSNERRRSRSRNKSRDRFRHRDSRRHHRTVLYESNALQDVAEPVLSQPYSSMQPNAFKNDGSFMEMFKKMQEQMQPVSTPQPLASSSFSLATSSASVLYEKTIPPPPLMVGKRRGGRILKTGMVAKPKSEPITDQPKDAWSLYMAEVKKYREVCCQEEDNTRPLVK
ncbi:arginine/serine-rich coiled-coil protein 2 [Neodiprion pinetum]|uniref:Serine/Arginine-related protein 53 n=1 Tax=Neodiprion lecontei TaxID=441921 RepID=A0A6J0BX15_NEOLC|nr:serine/Arginine-related protein 53 [Neodiprion lecontei]XP_046411035.1 serine/Arginine-related protein 53 [Neodiprion fabricii]XP_046492887.1 serine/Arginine-related protein 53 [Neodiprion pinetum]XP_046609413.1 serine/Arginine-related protein 53 [Neodiprion virginianus]